MLYQIESTAGVILGIYEGETARDAVAAMHADAGHLPDDDIDPMAGLIVSATPTTANTLRAEVAAIRAADRAGIGRMYARIVGYDVFEDDPAMSTDDGRDLLLDFIREQCWWVGVHCADAGL